jgi:hypothetical protein
MTDPVLGPDLLLRQYAWALLKYNDTFVSNSSPQRRETWDELNYGGLVPIVPLADEPELSDFSGPHIVYGYTGDTTGDHWMESSGTMTFAIYDDNFRRLGRTLNVLQAAFERADDAARDVNSFCSSLTLDNGATYPFRGLRFGCIEIGFIEGGTPENQEGGRQSALLNIRFDYFHEWNVTTNLTGFIA